VSGQDGGVRGQPTVLAAQLQVTQRAVLQPVLFYVSCSDTVMILTFLSKSEAKGYLTYFGTVSHSVIVSFAFCSVLMTKN
jgi:hypothetical protein